MVAQSTTEDYPSWAHWIEQNDVKPYEKRMFQEDKISAIKQVVLSHYNLQWEQVEAIGRVHKYMHPRFIISYFIKEFTNLSLVDIGRMYKNKSGKGQHYSTIINAIKQVEDWAETEKKFSRMIDELRILIKQKMIL